MQPNTNIKKLLVAVSIVLAPLYSVLQAQDLTAPVAPTIELLSEIPVEDASKLPENIPTTETPRPSAVEKFITTSGEPFPSVNEQSSVNWNSGANFSQRSKPLLGVWEPGDVPGTEIMRVSDLNGNGLHYYSSRQAWNSDMTKLMIGNGSVDSNRILDATNNYALLPTRIPLNTNRVWSNTNPDLIYGMLGSNEFVSFNVKTGTITKIYTDNSAITMRSKIALPGDDSKVVFYRPSENRIISFDIKNRKILGTLVWPGGNLDQGGGHIAYDWSGKWVTVLPNITLGKILHRLAPDLSGMTVISKHAGHSDMAFNSSGQSVQVVTMRNGKVAVPNYDDPAAIYISPTLIHANPNQADSRQPFYISGRGQKGSSGWALLSGEQGNGSPNFPLVLYKIDGNTQNATIKVVGYDHHSGGSSSAFGSNDAFQKGTHSADGNAIAFTSDWGSPGNISTYIIRDVSASQ